MSIAGKQTIKVGSQRNNLPSCWPGCLYGIGLSSKESRRIIDSCHSLLPGIKTKGSTNWVRVEVTMVACSGSEVGRRQMIAEHAKGWHGM